MYQCHLTQALTLVKEIKIGDDPEEVFGDVDIAILVGAKPRGPGMERRDLLKANGEIFVEQGNGEHVAYYDLFRLDNGKVVEHWDIIETILPKSEWKNQNGKFGF